MRSEMQTLIDVAEAFTAGGKPMTAKFSDFIDLQEIKNANISTPVAILAAPQLDVENELIKTAQSYIPGVYASLIVVAQKPSDAVEHALNIVATIESGPAGNIGKGNRPVLFRGVRFWHFRPANGPLPMFARNQNKLWIYETELYIAAKKV